MPPIVQINDLTKRFGNFTALDSVTLQIQEGEVFGLLGPNGAGKSTLIRTLLGFLNPTSGSANVNGLDCQTQRVAVRQQVSYLAGDARLHRMMRAQRVLKLFCGFRQSSADDDSGYQRAVKVAERLELDLSRWVGLMSTGMRQKLALAVTLSADVPLLILDEPTANLDPTVRSQVLAMVQEVKAAGKSVIFSSHVLSEIEDTCDRVGILRDGELVHVDSLKTLTRLHRIRARLDGQLPPLPEHLKNQVDIKMDRATVQIETETDMSDIWKWLSAASLSDVYVQPVGLRSIYDRYHHQGTIVSRTEANA